MTRIEFNHTKIKAKINKKRILEKISKIIDTGIFLNGDEEQLLNKKIKSFFSNGYFTTTASGHDSLILSLQSLNLANDDEVVFPVNSYPTVFPIILSNVKGIPCDVDENGQLDPESLIKNITKKTKVVIIVHLYGLVGKLDKIIQICRGKKLILIEDCAQAFGTKYKNKYVGTFGDIGCFSFFPTKNLGTLGDGGGIWVRKKEYYDYLIQAKSYGEKIKFSSNFISGHSRIPEIQASVLNIYLRDFKKDAEKRNKIFFYFKNEILRNNLNRYVRVLSSEKNSSPVPHLFVITAKKRSQLIKFLNNNGISSFVRYPIPIHKVPAFTFFKNKKFPQAEALSKEIICLPFHQYLNKQNIKNIVNTISKFYIQEI